jgi:ABC-type transport system substrate-binding protein
MNKLIDGARSTMDAEKRKKLYSELQKHIVANAYWVPMYAQYLLYGVANRINYEQVSHGMLRVFDINWRE